MSSVEDYRKPLVYEPLDGLFEAQNLEFLVFVQGQDLTPWVQEVSINRGTNGSADITFRDSFSSLTLTPENVLQDKWRTIPYGPLANDYAIPLTTDGSAGDNATVTATGTIGTPEDFQATASELPKKRIYDWKKKFNELATTGTITDGANGSASSLTQGVDDMLTWPLKPPQPIIQRMDTVRIFVAVPFLSQSEPNRWLPAFNGYVSAVSSTTSKSAGAADTTFNVSCQDLKYVLQKTRMSSNPIPLQVGTTGEAALTGSDNAETSNVILRLFRDSVITDGNFTNEINGKGLEEILCMLIFGHPNYIEGIDSATGSSRRYYAVGNMQHTTDKKRFFWFGGVNNPGDATIGSSYDGTNFQLGPWMDACLYGQDTAGNLRNKPWSLEDAYAAGLNSYYGGPDCAHGSNMFLRCLSPADGFGWQSLQKVEAVKGGTEFDFISRLDMIATITDPLNYKFWLSGNGDLIFEYSQADFLPHDYAYDADNGSPSWESTLKLFGYQSETHAENDVEVPTLLQIFGGNVAVGVSSSGSATDRIRGVTIALPALAARYGVIPQSLTFPFNFRSDSLAFYGLNFVQQKLAEAESFVYGGVTWVPGFMPNKPIYIQHNSLMCCITSTSLTVSRAGDISFSLDLDFPRKPQADGTYLTFFGTPHNPATYRDQYTQTLDTTPSGSPTASPSAANASAASTAAVKGGGSSGQTYTDSNGVSAANKARLAKTTLTPDQAATVAQVSHGDPAKAAFLTNVLTIENRGKTHPSNATSPAGAGGAFQLMPPTARNLGLTVNAGQDDRTDFGKSATAAATYYDQINRRYGGNTAAMYADYNGGPAQAKKVLAGNYGALPTETRDYVAMGNYLEQQQSGVTTPPNPERASNTQDPGQVYNFSKKHPNSVVYIDSSVPETNSDISIIKQSVLNPPNPQFAKNAAQLQSSAVKANTGGSPLNG